jgi:hypothetical protein
VFVEASTKDVLHVVAFDCNVIRGHTKKRNYTSDYKTFVVLDHFVALYELESPVSKKNMKYTSTWSS